MILRYLIRTLRLLHFKEQMLNEKYKDFLKVLKQLNVTIPFADALNSIPDYKKCMKQFLCKKRDLGMSQSVVSLNEKCSAVAQQNLPTKIKDPGNFIIPYKVWLKK